jgi:hypothetical protein
MVHTRTANALRNPSQRQLNDESTDSCVADLFSYTYGTSIHTTCHITRWCITKKERVKSVSMRLCYVPFDATQLARWLRQAAILTLRVVQHSKVESQMPSLTLQGSCSFHFAFNLNLQVHFNV